MRTILTFLVAALLPAGLSAQVQVGVQFNLGMQPAWGPPGHLHVEYYYLPEMEVYYHVPMRRYYYLDDGHWISGPVLPHRYRHVNLYHTRKVVINEPRPWHRHPHYRERFVTYGDDRHRHSYRDRHDDRRYEQRLHPGQGHGAKSKHGMKSGKGKSGKGHPGKGNPGKGNRGHGNGR